MACSVQEEQPKQEVMEVFGKNVKPFSDDRKHKNFQTLDNMTYRELQFFAGFYDIPRNLKKEMLKTLIKAKVEGRNEEVKLLLKEIKKARLLQSKKKKELVEIRYIAEHVEQNLKRETDDKVQVEVKPKVSKAQYKIKEILQKMVNESTSRNVTIHQTETHARYQALVDPAESRRNSRVMPHYRPQPFNYMPSGSTHYLPPRNSLPDNFQKHYALSSYGNGNFNYNCQGGGELVHSNSFPGAYFEPPLLPARQLPQFYQCYPAREVKMPPSPQGLDEFLCMRKSNSLQAVYSVPDSLVESQAGTYSGNTYVSNINVPYQRQLPSFLEFDPRKKLSRVETIVRPECDLPSKNRSTALECLANTALKVSEHTKEERRNCESNRLVIEEETERSFLGTLATSLTEGNTKPVVQDIPTWNHVLDQVSDNSANEGLINCKYGCFANILSRQQQVEHEVHCFMQPFYCPMTHCTWISQLASLDTHIFHVHNTEVIASNEAAFYLNFGSPDCKPCGSSATAMFGPKRLCFLQLIDHRLFVIFAIGNFETKQVVIYIQYLNDSADWMSSAAFEVTRTDGIPYQWTGRVLPLTYSSTHLITRRKCLIFNMNPENLANNFRLHTKIKNHIRK